MHGVSIRLLATGVSLLTLVPAAGAEDKPLFDLAAVKGMDKYTGPPEGKALLARDGMAITGEYCKELRDFYAGSMDAPPVTLPVFITTDVAVRCFGDALLDAFKQIEIAKAAQLPVCLAITWKNLAEAKEQNRWRDRAAVLIAAARTLADPKWQPATDAGKALLARIRADVDAELKRVKAEQIVEQAPLFGCAVDYSLCKPRSFYTDSEALQNFYRARVLLGFPMDLRDDSVLLTALALRECWVGGIPASEESDFAEDFLGVYDDLLGSLNLPTLAEGVPAPEDELDTDVERQIGEVLRDSPPDAKKLAAIRAVVRRTCRPPLAMGIELSDHLEKNRPLQVAILPTFAMMDSCAIQSMIWPQFPSRVQPSGMDAAAFLGNPLGRKLLIDSVPAEARKPLGERLARWDAHWARWDAYQLAPFEQRLYDDVPQPPAPRPGRVLDSYRRILATLWRLERTAAHPKFMATPAYAAKSLNTALGGWVAYRHMFQLHAHYIPFGGSTKPPDAGFVEPNLDFWDAMVDQVLEMQLLFESKGGTSRKFAKLALLCRKARGVAARQLAGTALTAEQNAWLRDFGVTLAGFYDTATSCDSKNRAIVATISTNVETQEALHVAIGLPQAIYAIFDCGGTPVLARGGVMSYREFWRPVSRGRLTDEQWRKLTVEGKSPPAPQWLRPFVAGEPKALGDWVADELATQREAESRPDSPP